MEQTINYATNIALVDRDGIAVNIIWGLIYQLDEFKRMAADAIVIDDRDVQIGDRYVNGDWSAGRRSSTRARRRSGPRRLRRSSTCCMKAGR